MYNSTCIVYAFIIEYALLSLHLRNENKLIIDTFNQLQSLCITILANKILNKRKSNNYFIFYVVCLCFDFFYFSLENYIAI